MEYKCAKVLLSAKLDKFFYCSCPSHLGKKILANDIDVCAAQIYF